MHTYLCFYLFAVHFPLWLKIFTTLSGKIFAAACTDRFMTVAPPHTQKLDKNRWHTQSAESPPATTTKRTTTTTTTTPTNATIAVK